MQACKRKNISFRGWLFLGLIFTVSCQNEPGERLASFQLKPSFTQDAYFSDPSIGRVYPSHDDLRFLHLAVPVYKSFSSTNPSSVTTCSSVLIGPNVVLTSAHCIYDLDDVKEIWFTTNALDRNFVVGRARVREVVIHPEYRKQKHPVDAISYDLALVFFRLEDLSSKMISSLRILRLAQPSQVNIQSNTVFSFMGWGAQAGHSRNTVNDGQLRRLALPGEVSLNRDGAWIVVKNTTKKWALCSGDSGGPLAYLVPSTREGLRYDFYVVGIFSSTAALREGSQLDFCHEYTEMRFTSILPHRQWIINTIMDNSLGYIGTPEDF